MAASRRGRPRPTVTAGSHGGQQQPSESAGELRSCRHRGRPLSRPDGSAEAGIRPDSGAAGRARDRQGQAAGTMLGWMHGGAAGAASDSREGRAAARRLRQGTAAAGFACDVPQGAAAGMVQDAGRAAVGAARRAPAAAAPAAAPALGGAAPMLAQGRAAKRAKAAGAAAEAKAPGDVAPAAAQDGTAAGGTPAASARGRGSTCRVGSRIRSLASLHTGAATAALGEGAKRVGRCLVPRQRDKGSQGQAVGRKRSAEADAVLAEGGSPLLVTGRRLRLRRS